MGEEYVGEPIVTINAQLYEELVEDSKFLNALRCGGVDNWEGYSEACEQMGDE